MLKHQEDWAGLALVFCNVCVGSHSQMELLRFCCCVTMALLKEPKGKLTLPYELFAESGTHCEVIHMYSSTQKCGVKKIFERCLHLFNQKNINSIFEMLL